MYNQGLANALGYGGMTHEDTLLHIERRATQRIKARLTDSHHPRVGGQGFNALEHGIDVGRGRVPRMYSIGEMRNIAPRVDAKRHVDYGVGSCRQAMGVYVGKPAQQFY